jgi:choloylglycine hydrolase
MAGYTAGSNMATSYAPTLLALAVLVSPSAPSPTPGSLAVPRACTGISLVAADGTQVVGRTVEWALGDAGHDRLLIVPRGESFRGLTPDGENGHAWRGRHGFVTLTAYGTDYGPDAVNEHGLYVGMYYFPGYAQGAPYEPDAAARSLSVGDFQRWLLSMWTSVAEVKQHLLDLRVVDVADPRFGGAALPFHWKIADSTGDCIIVEIVDGGKVRVFDAFLGVVTNSPSYDWHLTNLRNYVGLSARPDQPITIAGRTGGPFGSGSGLLGLPGDFTPPSRFVRAAAMTASVRQLANAEEAVFEAFRILDNFNIPIGASAPADAQATDIPSATQITVVTDLTHRTLWFHTMHNREVRKLELGKIDFAKVKRQVLDESPRRSQAVRELSLAPL